jgi:CCR4-NOT transcription complex subunit 4
MCVQLSINLGANTSAARQAQAGAAYVVYHSPDDAWACIEDLNNRTVAGRVVKACFGTTKYCHAFLKGLPCNNPDCQYLHQLGALIVLSLVV